jgi:uncharacterized protein
MVQKIINDPVYGFITVSDELVLRVISHPWYQRLRRIHQMALASLVYPGAVHTRLHHSLGAYHLMHHAIQELKNKGVVIDAAEEQAASIAILLHDVGHGPFSHALEHTLVPGVSHEQISLLIMEELNREFDGRLTMAIDVFTNRYPKKFLHQLVSGQLDVDRMDYLTRDSFFTGVSEGMIGYDRITKMLTVHEGQLMVEEKAIYSIEKFLVARRLMYWQAYLHKTVLSAEKMLVKIIERAKETGAVSPSYFLNQFLHGNLLEQKTTEWLRNFCYLDDQDVLMSVKTWMHHEDPVLRMMCTMLLNRNLYRVAFVPDQQQEAGVQQKRKEACLLWGIDEKDGHYLAFDGIAENSTYKENDEQIHILFKNGMVKQISEVENALVHQSIAAPVRKYYICSVRNPIPGK